MNNMAMNVRMVPTEIQSDYVRYLKVILVRKRGKVNPARSFMLSRQRELPKELALQPHGGHVFDQYLNLLEDRLHWPMGFPTINKLNKMRRMGGYI